ncbi:CGNR zinc finger domain-containing protein [Mesorhizobium sp. NPDC059054]|uniref:CGNR zinc finger domain-containing protein n=1 Tax=Mesorhizobium sp. NPDC059054 TaxID=3346711 RepID=UPI0036B7B888
MTVSWIQHRFAGGALALDTANTVVLRGDPYRGFDRFEDRAEIARFAEAAGAFRAAELGGRRLEAREPERIAPVVLEIREATDRLFREAVLEGSFESNHLSDFLAACSKGTAGARGKIGGEKRPFGDPATPLAFEAALAVSALSLLGGDTMRRLRICANCRWLFVDRSRNSSRLWCDMAVCGNRRKASRHYHRRKDTREADRG